MARKTFRQIVSTMTYRDMVDLTTMIAEALPDCASPEDVANVLLDLPEDDQQTCDSNLILARLFRRKKQITVQKEGTDIFKICCPTVEGAVVFDRDIREGVSQLLDTLTILQAFDDG